VENDAEHVVIYLERSTGTSILVHAGVADLLERPGDIFAGHRFRMFAANGGVTSLKFDKPGAHAGHWILLLAALLDIEQGDQTLDLSDGRRRVRSLADDVAFGGNDIGSTTVYVSGLVVDNRNGRSSGCGNGNQSAGDEELKDEEHLGVDMEAHLDNGRGSRCR